MTQTSKKSTEPNIKKLKEAVAARKFAKPIGQIASHSVYNDMYWFPSTLGLPQATKEDLSGSGVGLRSAPSKNLYKKRPKILRYLKKMRKTKTLLCMGYSDGSSNNCSSYSSFTGRGRGECGIGRSHRSSLALGVVNSSSSLVILAGITWYLIGTYAVELLKALRSKLRMYKN